MTKNNCRWISEPDYPVVFDYQKCWKTECNNRYIFDHLELPSVSHFKFCPYCGKSINEEELNND